MINSMTMLRNTIVLTFTITGCYPSFAQTLNPFGNALIPDMIADASIQEIDGIFYCYATTDGYDRGLETSGPPVVWKSEDFVNWSFDGIYFPSASNQKYWAPSKVAEANGKYYIYPTINGYMYPAVSDSPNGPFKLAKGNDVFDKSPTASTLIESDKPDGIDTEIFIDDDGQAYAYWGRRCASKLNNDMVTLDGEVVYIDTPRKGYSEGPIFFKRNGIYYYLYTIGGDEKYQYYYVMSRVSPLGPWEFPENDIVSTTNYEKGVYGPGHGCVFSTKNDDQYYFAFLEFGRRSTNRQTYVNKLDFNNDGTIRQVDVSLEGVGALRKVKQDKKLKIVSFQASSTREPLWIKPMKDDKLDRTEYFDATFAGDASNGSRWMAADNDTDCFIIADLGSAKRVKRSEVYFVRPTAGHIYSIDASKDGVNWTKCGGSDGHMLKSPLVDNVDGKYRYLRLRINDGVKGVWEWNLY